MLACEDCERYLEAFLDQELGVKESLDMQAHLYACSACRGLVEAERTCRRFVREHGYERPLPDTMKIQLIRRAMEGARPVVAEPQVRWWEWLGTWIQAKDFALGMVTAAAILLFFFGPFSLSSQDDDMTMPFRPERVVQETSMAYRATQSGPVPLEVAASDDKAVADWFSRHLTYSFKVPCITDNATKLLGGRLCRLFDRPSATFVYKRNGKDVMLFAFRGNGVSLPTQNRISALDREVYLRDVSGRPVAVWQHDGIVYSMVGDLKRDDLIKITKTMSYR